MNLMVPMIFLAILCFALGFLIGGLVMQWIIRGNDR